jgi:hypothetical protein
MTSHASPDMQVPDLIWSELVSHVADLFESGGRFERHAFRDWDIGDASTVPCRLLGCVGSQGHRTQGSRR